LLRLEADVVEVGEGAEVLLLALSLIEAVSNTGAVLASVSELGTSGSENDGFEDSANKLGSKLGSAVVFG
jgi:hypothetical protein